MVRLIYGGSKMIKIELNVSGQTRKIELQDEVLFNALLSKNKKAINDTLNKALEEILLNDNNSSNISDNLLEKKLEKLQNEIRTLKKD